MAYKQTSKQKRRTKALPVLGAAGVSLTMAGGASAAVAPTVNGPLHDVAPPPVFALDEEEISDVSLATFYVFDREGQSLGERLQLAQRGCRGGGGCRAGGGCAARGCAARGCAGRGCAARGCAARCAGGCRCGVGVARCGVGCGGCTCSCCLSWGACNVTC
jgi:hypothetical protein